MTDYTKEDAIMEKLEEVAAEENDTTDLVIYDVPVEVRDKFISMTKLHYDNEGWRLLADAINMILQHQNDDLEDLKEKVNRLEKQINIMKGLTKYSQSQKNDSSSKATFGDLKETDTASDLEKLENISDTTRGDNQE